LTTPEKGVEEGKEYLIFLFVEGNEAPKYIAKRQERRLGKRFKIVRIPRKRGPDYAGTLMLYFQASCRKALMDPSMGPSRCAFEL